MLSIESLAQAVYDRIVNVYQHGFEMKDENDQLTEDPEQGRIFNFPFIQGNDYTAVSVTLNDGTDGVNKDKELKIIYAEDVDKYLTPDQRKVWYDWKEGLKKLAVEHMFGFKDQNISRPPFVRQPDSAQSIAESLSGTSRSSYQLIGPVKIIARHSKKIDPEQRGARARNIAELFVETSEGERFKLPEGTSLNAARAYARHIKNGGSRDDDFGQHITKMVAEMNNLRHFVRNMRGRVFEDEETTDMVQSAINYYGNLHRTIFSLRGQRGYQQYKNLWQPEQVEEETVDIDSLKERFVKKVFDDRLTAALPIVDKVYKNFKNKEILEFENWAEEVTEELETLEQNPIDRQNKKIRDAGLDIEESNSVIDNDDPDPKVERLLNDNEFNYRVEDGIIYFDSLEEIERAKDIFAADDPNMPFPEMAVKKYDYGVFGGSTWERDLNSNPPLEENMNFLKKLAGIR